MMIQEKSPSLEDSPRTSAKSTDKQEAIPGGSISANLSHDSPGHVMAVLPVDTPSASAGVQCCFDETAVPEGGNNRQSSIHTQHTRPANEILRGLSAGGSSELLTDEYVPAFNNTSGLDKTDLSPSSFTSLAEAFCASLYVVRCLRNALCLVQGAQQQDTCDWQQRGNYGGSTFPRPSTESLSRAANFVSVQESFIADDAAYAELLSKARTAPPTDPHAQIQPTPQDTNATQSALSDFNTPVAATESLRGPFPEAPTLAVDATQADGGKGAASSPAAGGHSCMARTATPGGLEYELSVCKALLLLQNLTTYNTAVGEEAPPSSAPPVRSPRLNQHTRYSEGRTPAELLHSTSAHTSKREGPSAHNIGPSSAALLDALLHVRLLQGTQQLLRADFVRLLRQQRKQHHQLKHALQTTVMKLEAERDALLGRMHKLSTVEGRK